MSEIYTVCLECGRKHDKKHKSSFGVWTDDCDMCGAKQVPCADAGHDFGVYNDEEHRLRDEATSI